MVTRTFGDVLFSPGPECLKEFPSPESLKKRVIISTKPPKEYLQAKEIKEKEVDPQKGKAADEDAWGKEVPDLRQDIANDDKVVTLCMKDGVILTFMDFDFECCCVTFLSLG